MPQENTVDAATSDSPGDPLAASQVQWGAMLGGVTLGVLGTVGLPLLGVFDWRAWLVALATITSLAYTAWNSRVVLRELPAAQSDPEADTTSEPGARSLRSPPDSTHTLPRLPDLSGLPPAIQEDLAMVLLEEGQFRMGGQRYQEKPRHDVRIQRLGVSVFPVTERVFAFIAEQVSGGSRRPVTQVSWHEAREFCDKLSMATGLEPVYADGYKSERNGFRLPSESEWEYATRAGTVTEYYWGDDPELATDYAWLQANSGSSQPVGEKSPNPWSLYDVSGNVREWVEDVWHRNYEGAPADGSPWVRDGYQSLRVLRGGAWFFATDSLRSASRDLGGAHYHSSDVGFRVVCRPHPSSADR